VAPDCVGCTCSLSPQLHAWLCACGACGGARRPTHTHSHTSHTHTWDVHVAGTRTRDATRGARGAWMPRRWLRAMGSPNKDTRLCGRTAEDTTRSRPPPALQRSTHITTTGGALCTLALPATRTCTDPHIRFLGMPPIWRMARSVLPHNAAGVQAREWTAGKANERRHGHTYEQRHAREEGLDNKKSTRRIPTERESLAGRRRLRLTRPYLPFAVLVAYQLPHKLHGLVRRHAAAAARLHRTDSALAILLRERRVA
jgi:hypothetical protein